MWQVPDSWTLEDAATVSAVYITVLYALLLVEYEKTGRMLFLLPSLAFEIKHSNKFNVLQKTKCQLG